MYTLYNTSVELDTRLATVPQPVFHYNILLASLAIDNFFSEDSKSIFQQLSGYQPQLLTSATQSSEVYDLWADCRGDSAFGFGCLAITRETDTLRPRACTLPSNVYSMACTSQHECDNTDNKWRIKIIPKEEVAVYFNPYDATYRSDRLSALALKPPQPKRPAHF
jgi:hypothetical protein